MSVRSSILLRSRKSTRGSVTTLRTTFSLRHQSSVTSQKIMTGVQRAFAFGLFGLTGLGSGLLLITVGQSLSRFNENREAQETGVHIETPTDS
jgi:hypothetical protein